MPEYCPNLEVIRLIGFSIENSQEISSGKGFRKLRVLDVRLVQQDLIRPLLRKFLEESSNIEEITINTSCTDLDSDYLMDLMKPNTMIKLQKLVMAMSPNTHLTTVVARRIVELLPNLNILGVTRWNMTSREVTVLRNELQEKNIDIRLV